MPRFPATVRAMEQYKQEFIDFIVKVGALQFGSFTMKSGRQAPYFFNAGAFSDGESIAKLGQYYASAAAQWGVDFDVIFGPAYKGIPLAVTTAVALSQNYKRNVGYACNRKEAKDHGEGGILMGAKITSQTRVLLIDDVMTAGTAVRQSLDILKQNGSPHVVGILIAIDRQEKNNDGVSAIAAIEKEHGIGIHSIVTFDEIVGHLSGHSLFKAHAEEVAAYRTKYGI